MPENNSRIATLHQLLENNASQLLYAETQLSDCLGEWIDRSVSLPLKNVLQKYVQFVQQHIEALKDLGNEVPGSTMGIASKVMPALISEANEKMANCTDAQVQDACLLASVQLINHYKICAYGTAAAYSYALGNEKWEGIFRNIEVNEKHIDDRLSQLANHEINSKAIAPIVLPG